MRLTACPQESAVRELLQLGQWPAAADPELRAHIANCRSCGDLALVSQALLKSRAESLAAARIPAPGILFWRAQLRRRNAVVQRLSRPIVSAEIFALASALLAALGFGAFEARHGLAWLTWLQQFQQNGGLRWSALLAPDQGSTWGILLPAFAALALLGGLAAYFVSERQ